MATAIASQPVTIREYLKFKSPEGFRDELIYGKIIVSPEPKILHFQIADNLYKLLGKSVSRKFRVAQRVNLRLPALNSMPRVQRCSSLIVTNTAQPCSPASILTAREFCLLLRFYLRAIEKKQCN